MKKFSEAKRNILNIAFEFFSELGYDLTSIGQITEKVGIKKASFYSHFKSKEELFYIIFSDILFEHKNFLNGMFKKSHSFDVKNCLKYIFMEYIHYCVNNRDIYFWNKVYFSPPKDFKEEILEKTKEIEELIIENLKIIFKKGIKESAIKTDNLESMVCVFYNTQLGFILSIENYKRENFDDLYEGCYEIIWDGLSLERER